jgi:tetratricopeptide (TPR) repeat protein
LESPSLDSKDAKSERAFILMLLGERYLGYSEQVKKGKRLMRQSLSLYNELDEHWWDMESLQSLGGYVWYEIDLPDTESFLMKSLQFKRAQGDLFGMANLLAELGKFTLNHKCDPERAKRYFLESSDIFQVFSDPVSAIRSSINLDIVFVINGMFPESFEIRNQQLHLYKNLGDRINVGYSQARIGETNHMLGDYEAVERFGRMGLSILRDDDVWHRAGFANWYLGLTLLAMNNFSEAMQYLLETAVIYQDKGFKPGVAKALAAIGRAEIGLGNPIGAWNHAREALALFVDTPAFLHLLYAISTIAFLLIDRDEILKAVELYALVSKQPFVANSIWFEDVYGVYIQTAAASLPPEGVEVAKERGRTLDLMDTARKLLTEI